MTRTALHFAALLAAAALLGTACGPKTYNLTPPSARDTVASAPKWFLNPPAEDDALVAAATATSRDMQTAFDKARTLAQTDLSQQLGVRMANLTKQFQEEVGLASNSEFLTQFSSATKAVTNETLVGARLSQRQMRPEDSVYRAFVLLSLPIGQANQLLMQKLKASDSLYTRFRATEAYDGLEESIKAYRDGESSGSLPR